MTHSQTESLLKHQWNVYPRFHRSRANLLVHVVAVPVFLVANVGLVLALVRGEWVVAVVSAALMGASMFAQGRGHRMEVTPAEPFTGPLNALARLFAEQWIAFPRFLLTGRWLESLRRRPTPDR